MTCIFSWQGKSGDRGIDFKMKSIESRESNENSRGFHVGLSATLGVAAGKTCIFSTRGKSRDRGIEYVQKVLYWIQGELPQTVSKARPAVTMATAWHPRGIKVDESERGEHEEMTSQLDKLDER